MNDSLLPNGMGAWWRVFALATFFSAAQAGENHPQNLSRSESLSLQSVVDSAVAIAPEEQQSAAYSGLAKAQATQGSHWLAGPPALQMAYQTDSVDNDLGYRESQLGITLPLWRPEQKEAYRNLASQYETFARLYPEAVRLEVSGQVRESLWSVQWTEARRNLSQEALDVSRQLEAKVERQVELGSAARAALMAARRERLLREAEALQAESEWKMEQQHYQHITGLESLPAHVAEAAVVSGFREHPQLALSRLHMEQAEAYVQAARGRGNGQPELTVAGRRERPERGTEAQQYLALELSLPIGGSAHSGVSTAEALEKVSTARAGYHRQKLTLEAAREETGMKLQALEQQLPMSTEQLSLAEQQYQMDQRAYESGVMDLLELLRTQSALLSIRRDHQLLQIEIGRTRAELNQISGVSL